MKGDNSGPWRRCGPSYWGPGPGDRAQVAKLLLRLLIVSLLRRRRNLWVRWGFRLVLFPIASHADKLLPIPYNLSSASGAL